MVVVVVKPNSSFVAITLWGSADTVFVQSMFSLAGGSFKSLQTGVPSLVSSKLPRGSWLLRVRDIEACLGSMGVQQPEFDISLVLSIATVQWSPVARSCCLSWHIILVSFVIVSDGIRSLTINERLTGDSSCVTSLAESTMTVSSEVNICAWSRVEIGRLVTNAGEYLSCPCKYYQL